MSNAIDSSAQSTPLPPPALQGNAVFATSVALLLVRLVLGWTFIYHGSQKAFGVFDGPGIGGTMGIVGGMMPGILPASVWACMLAYGELLGGILVLLGFMGRLGTIPIIISMLVAIAKVHGPIGFSNSKPGLPGYEFNLALLALSAMVLIVGPGLISLDALWFRRSFWARGAQPLGNPIARA